MFYRFSVIGVVVGSLFLANPSAAQSCDCESVAGTSESIFETTSLNNRHMKLRFEASPVTRQARVASFCVEPAATVSAASLWMPEHGHGSSPTRLLPVREGCTLIERMSFVMGGSWEIRVRLSDDDSGVFSIGVESSN